MIYLFSQITVVLLTKITPILLHHVTLWRWTEMAGDVWREADHSLGRERACLHRRRVPAMWLLIYAVGVQAACRVLPWPQSWEWGRGRCDLLLGNLLTSECSWHLHTVPRNLRKLPEAQRMYDPGMISKCDQSMGPGHCTHMGMNAPPRPPPAPPVLICSTALSSDPCQAMGVTVA